MVHAVVLESEFLPLAATAHSSGDSKCSKLKFSRINGEMNGTMATYIHYFEMHDGCLILRVTLVMIYRNELFSDEGKAKLKRLQKARY
jgi:hypothetical protein